jgi:hypothetical protein
MTIADASTIIAADVNALITSGLATIQDDNDRLPLCFRFATQFPNLVASTDPLYSRARFVLPFDCYLETLAVLCGDQTASSSITATLTADGAQRDWPTSITGTAGAGATALGRLLYDNTKSKIQKNSFGFGANARAFRTFTKGGTAILAMSTTNVATSSVVSVSLVFRQFFGRD